MVHEGVSQFTLVYALSSFEEIARLFQIFAFKKISLHLGAHSYPFLFPSCYSSWDSAAENRADPKLLFSVFPVGM
jgi:hypothetical protein